MKLVLMSPDIYYELGLGDDVPQHWDVVIDTCGEREEGGGGEKGGTCSVSKHCPTHTHGHQLPLMQ